MAYHHMRTPSSASDIHLTDTVSYLQRCVCGNMFRSQRQFARFFVILAVVMLLLYLTEPWGSSQHEGSDMKVHTKTSTIKSIPETEYRARYFEEIGRRMDQKLAESALQNSERNEMGSDQENLDGRSAVDLQLVADKVKQIAEKVAKCRDVPGLTMVMVHGDKSVLLPMGLANVKSQRAVTEETHFLLNSISKTFLGQLLAVLIKETSNNITLDTPVSSILGPDFHLATAELTDRLTLRDLMSHRSGLSSGNLAVRATYPAGWTTAYLASKLGFLPPSAALRKTFLYSNMGSMLATHIAEKLGGAPWGKLIVEKLLVPLGMTNSGPLKSHTDLLGEEFAQPYVPVDGKLTECDTRIFDQGPLSSVALLASTASDMAKWVRFNLRRGRLEDGRQLIPADLWEEMWTPQIELSPMFLQAVDKTSTRWPVKDSSEGYGLYWFINKYRGLRNYWHGGGLYTHYGLTWTFPEKHVGLYIAISGYSGDSRPFSVVESLAYYAADLLLGYQPWLEETSVCQYPELWSSNSKASYNHSAQYTEDKVGHGTESRFWHSEKDSALPESAPAIDRAPAALSANAHLSGKARGKFAAVSDSFAKLNTEMTQGGQSEQLLQADKSGVRLSRTKREQNLVNVQQFHIPEDQEASVNVRSMVDGDNSDSVNVKSGAGKQTVGGFLPLRGYEGFYSHPLIGNVTVRADSASSHLECKMNVLTGVLLPAAQQHVFGLELTGSLRFLSKPSGNLPAKQVYRVEFVVGANGEAPEALDFHSNWAMEVPLRFAKLR